MRALLIAVIAAFFVCVNVLAGSLVGTFAGWLVGYFFTDELHMLAKIMSIPQAAPWQIGMILGFVGGFFRASVSSK